MIRKNNMKTISFVTFDGISVQSTLIRYFTRTRTTSHVAFKGTHLIECWSTPGNLLMKWTISSFKYHTPGTPYEVWSKSYPDDVADAIEDYFYSILGTKYDWLGVGGFVLRFVDDSEKRLFCSEGCIIPLKEHHKLTELKPSNTDPHTFKVILQALGFERTYEGIV